MLEQIAEKQKPPLHLHAKHWARKRGLIHLFSQIIYNTSTARISD